VHAEQENKCSVQSHHSCANSKGKPTPFRDSAFTIGAAILFSQSGYLGFFDRHLPGAAAGCAIAVVSFAGSATLRAGHVLLSQSEFLAHLSGLSWKLIMPGYLKMCSRPNISSRELRPTQGVPLAQGRQRPPLAIAILSCH
jgi:hypothetical protein